MSDSLSNKELVAVGHQFAKTMSSDTPIIDMAKIVPVWPSGWTAPRWRYGKRLSSGMRWRPCSTTTAGGEIVKPENYWK